MIPINRQPFQRHWALIETGGNQRYIFDSNRLRHVVGASQLVHEVGTRWVPEAVDGLGLPPDTVVMTTSGKALLVVDSRPAGCAVIRAVTERALREAPGLQVTGVVGPAFDPSARRDDPTNYETARRDTYELHARVRASRPDPQLRDRVFPWHQLCRDSGQPAAREDRYGPDTGPEDPWQPASAGILARSAARHRAGLRMSDLLGDWSFMVPAHLDELRHSGWIAIIHADGNGVGALFRDFASHVARVHGDPVDSLVYCDYQHRVARELDEATQSAVVEAVSTLSGDHASLAGRFLPIVVGGDDVTVACDAALALPFVRGFAPAFARHTADQPTLSAIARAATGRDNLTASAGIAVVKSHHPFARAYELAEDLTTQAKRFTVSAGGKLAAFDFHVAHSSTLRDLENSREYLVPARSAPSSAAPIARHAGPYLLAEPAPAALAHRSVEFLDTILSWMTPEGWLSATQAHALRDAADRSLEEYRHQLQLVIRDAPDPTIRSQAAALLDVQLDVQPVAGLPRPESPFLRLFDALHLRGLRLASSDQPDPVSEPTREGGTR